MAAAAATTMAAETTASAAALEAATAAAAAYTISCPRPGHGAHFRKVLIESAMDHDNADYPV